MDDAPKPRVSPRLSLLSLGSLLTMTAVAFSGLDLSPDDVARMTVKLAADGRALVAMLSQRVGFRPLADAFQVQL